jgi:hypothetical protein
MPQKTKPKKKDSNNNPATPKRIATETPNYQQFSRRRRIPSKPKQGKLNDNNQKQRLTPNQSVQVPSWIRPNLSPTIFIDPFASSQARICHLI